MSTPTFAFPAPLAEKYRPRSMAEFIGLESLSEDHGEFCRATRAPQRFCSRGQAGMGKTTMALAVCEAMGGSNPSSSLT